MHKLLLAVFIGIFTFSFMITDASAARFGGGRSFGVSRQASSFVRPSSAPYSAPYSRPATPNSGSKWLGPLAGFAAGGLLASLFMGHGGGMGGGILSWLLMGGLIFFVIRFITSRFQPAVQQMQTANYQAQAQPTQPFSNVTPFNFNQQQNSAAPIGFDEAGFLRQAKASFIRLQAAYDVKNLADLREFTAPEVFAEIQLQLQERGDAPNQTDVISIDAQLLGVDPQGETTLASVEFTGLVREEANAAPISIKEIWHFQKNSFQPNWVVAGIQQV